jgi:ABC-type sugar transport system ATPase subunit
MSLAVVNLSKRIKDKWIFRDVSFEVSNGEIFGIYGLSGAGKTVLLESIFGSTPTSGGTIFYDGVDLTKEKPQARGFHAPRFSGRSLRRSLFGWFNAGVLHEEQSRALKYAVTAADRVLLLDDPFRSMDAFEQEAGFEACRTAVSKASPAVVFASSDFDHVFRLCDRVAIIAEGEIKQIGQPKEIYEKPESHLVARITGRNNLFGGRRLTSSKAEVPEFQTMDGEHRVFAQRSERASLGAINQNVTLGIRPEHISISFGASFPADNLLKAEITGVDHLGATTLVHLDAGGLALDALVLRLVGLSVGDECMVGLPPERIQIFRQ